MSATTWLVRGVVVLGLGLDAALMLRTYGVTSRGLDAMRIYLCLGFVLPVLALACAPCFALAGRLRAADPAVRRRARLHSVWPLALALLAGVGICFGDWEKLWFVATPLAPPLVLLAALAFLREQPPQGMRDVRP